MRSAVRMRGDIQQTRGLMASAARMLGITLSAALASACGAQATPMAARPVPLEAPGPRLARLDIRAPAQGVALMGADIPSDQNRWGDLEWSGISGAGAGLVVLGVGGYVLSSALAKNADSKQDCTGNLCGDRGYALRRSAVRHGNEATVLGIVGGTLVAGGATLFVVGRSF